MKRHSNKIFLIILTITLLISCAACSLFTWEKGVSVDSVSFEELKYDIVVGDTMELRVVFNPTEAADKSYSLKSSNITIAKIEDGNNIKGLAVGEATITVTSNNGKTANCLINVMPDIPTSIVINATNGQQIVGQAIEEVSLSVEHIFDKAPIEDELDKYKYRWTVEKDIIFGLLYEMEINEITTTPEFTYTFANNNLQERRITCEVLYISEDTNDDTNDEFVINAEGQRLVTDLTIGVYNEVTEIELISDRTTAELLELMPMGESIVFSAKLNNGVTPGLDIEYIVEVDYLDDRATTITKVTNKDGLSLKPVNLAKYTVSAKVANSQGVYYESNEISFTTRYAEVTEVVVQYDGSLRQGTSNLMDIVFTASYSEYAEPNQITEWYVNNVKISEGTEFTYKPLESDLETEIYSVIAGVKSKILTVNVQEVAINTIEIDTEDVLIQTSIAEDVVFGNNVYPNIADATTALSWYVNDKYVDTATNYTLIPVMNGGDYGEYEVYAKSNQVKSNTITVIVSNGNVNESYYIDNHYTENIAGNRYITSLDELRLMLTYMTISNIYTMDVYYAFAVTDSDYREAVGLIQESGNFKYSVVGGIKAQTLYFDILPTVSPTKSSGQRELVTKGEKPTYSINVNERTEFPIDRIEQTMSVTTSNELFNAVEWGYRPIPTVGSDAERIYNIAREVNATYIQENDDDVKKMLTIYEWIIVNTTYDHEIIEILDDPTLSINEGLLYNAFYLEGVFDDNVAVCDGKAKAVVLLAGIEGIKAIKCTGLVYEGSDSEGAHAWNKVLIDANDDQIAEWYIIDTTWGDSSNAWQTEERLSYDYFLKTEAQLTHHTEEYKTVDAKTHYVFNKADFL